MFLYLVFTPLFTTFFMKNTLTQLLLLGNKIIKNTKQNKLYIIS